MRKNVFWFIMIMLLAFTSLHSGCGGSSGGDVSTDGNNGTDQRQEVTPEPETPSTPDNPSTPESPTTPDTPTTTIYPFTVLTGTWTASNGTATKTDVDSGAGLGFRMVGQNNISFSDIQVNGDTAVVSTQGTIRWGDGGNMGYSSKPMEFQRISGNTWRSVSSRGETLTLTITSPTTVNAEEERTFEYKEEGKTYKWAANYTLTKQGSSSTPNTPATGTLNGTWRITGGTLTYPGPNNDYEQGAHTASYVQGSASAETFTLALSEAGNDSYVLTVSGEGVSKKEGSPYVEAYFDGIDDEVRVVWGTSEDWEDWPYGDGSTYKLTDSSTYHAEFPGVVHDVSYATYQLTSNSTIRYTQTGPSIHRNDTKVKVELTLERVN